MQMKNRQVNSPRTPLYRDTGFELYDAGTTAGSFSEEAAHEREPEMYIYSRYRNPTVVAAEEEVMKLERCEWALLTQSGMAAIDTAVSIFQQGKNTLPWFFFTEIYGGTLSYIDTILRKRRGVEIVTLSPNNGAYNLNVFEKVILDIKPAFVYAETISNPLLVVADITAIIDISHKYGSKVIIDNTFATPLLFRPLEHGADIVIHSATKYLAGHGNITAGVICGNDPDLGRAMVEYRKFVGHMLSPDDAYRLNTQLKTFELRVKQQCLNARMLADWLAREKAIERVFYPGLPGHKTHNIAVTLLGNEYFGAMITFDFAGNTPEEKRKRRDAFIAGVSDTIKLIPTLGDPGTILMPVEAVWGTKYPEPGMIRLSVGFEDYNDLIDIVSGAIRLL
jgi:cystathionine beta-lyase/cystathionine gamma-synthase